MFICDMIQLLNILLWMLVLDGIGIICMVGCLLVGSVMVLVVVWVLDMMMQGSIEVEGGLISGLRVCVGDWWENI